MWCKVLFQKLLTFFFHFFFLALKIHVSPETKSCLDQFSTFELEQRSEIEVKVRTNAIFKDEICKLDTLWKEVETFLKRKKIPFLIYSAPFISLFVWKSSFGKWQFPVSNGLKFQFSLEQESYVVKKRLFTNFPTT